MDTAKDSARVPSMTAVMALLLGVLVVGTVAVAPSTAAPPSRHWAFAPVERPEPPAVEDASWCRTPIDCFVRARQEAEGVGPSAEADRATLIRRLCLDLLGLPPAPAEVERFLRDRSPDAHERLVDRLLASPHHGERWGRHWLDLARYGDSNGFTIDSARSIWPYRDWVIDAINRGMPFDRFVVEQLAGDMLPDAARAQIIATGFHRNTLINEEGGTDDEQFRVESIVDRVNTTGTVFLGLSVGCGECHDHKYDPLLQREYYRLFAFFNNCSEPQLDLPSPTQKIELDRLNAGLAVDRNRVGEYDAAAQPEWERRVAAAGEPEWAVLDPLEFSSSTGSALTRLDDGSVLVSGVAMAVDTYTVAATTPAGSVTAIRLEALTHDSLPRQGPGLAKDGDFLLAGVEAAIETPDVQSRQVTWARVIAEHAAKEYPAAGLIDGKDSTGWAVGGSNVDRVAILVFAEALAVSTDSRLVVRLGHAPSRPAYRIGRFRLAVTGAPATALDLPAPVHAALRVPAQKRDTKQLEVVAGAYRKHAPQRRPLQVAVERWVGQVEGLRRKIPTTMVLAEQSKPRETFVHIRGDFLRRGERVFPGVPAFLSPLEAGVDGGQPNRLDLARWLVGSRNPLTARVTVNRYWQRFFGVGIVPTENDFGTRGVPPTHPRLLDWLASEFVRSGWNVKALQRLIVTSAVYRQSSRLRKDLARVDPKNRLLLRQRRLRLEAEVLRDVALATSGLLSRQIGGPGVYPPQPTGLDSFTQTRKKWTASEGSGRFRRGLYTFYWRSNPHPFLVTFDAPDGNSACTRRMRSNTPLQALTLANDVTFVEIARALARRVLDDEGAGAGEGDAARIEHLFELCLSRSPGDTERKIVTDFLQTQRREFAAAPKDAGVLVPEADRPEGVAAAEAAAWTAVARTLINVDEFITRE